MREESNNKFNAKIIFSYLVLCVLAFVAGYFIYSEIRVFITNETVEENDNKLLKTGSLIAELYEVEGVSKRVSQVKTKESLAAYEQKIDTIFAEIDSLKLLSEYASQKNLLDSLQVLLQKKVANSKQLFTLKAQSKNNNSIDKALKEFDKIEESYGKFSAENLWSNFDEFSPKIQQSLREYALLFTENSPKKADGREDAAYIDSILNASKAQLLSAKRKSAATENSLARKELEISKNDLELSQQLRAIISAFEQEVMTSTYNDNLKKEAALKKTMRLAGIKAILGFIIVGLFTFLINRDFWKVQTYREKLEKEKKYSESLLKSREQLISTVSHDLRTPLHTITGYTELMESTELTKKQQRYLRNVKSSTQYVGNLVNDLLDFSKLEAGKLNIEKVPFVAAHLIQETAESLQALHSNKNLKLFLEIGPELHKTVLGDPFRIRQILTNLIGNAFKFTENGHIKIRATATLGREKSMVAKIDIIDTGIGIAKEKQEHIFKEFTQADHDTEKKFGGYGLGLTISKKLTELLKGSLSLHSTVGQGSTFTIQIPLKIADAKEAKQKEKPYMAPKLRMLIIDDDTSLLRMLQELAESMGITAHAFTNFLRVEEDAHLAYDIVLTDIQMPQVTGFEVLKKLKSGTYKHYKNQPIIAMTGRRDLEPEAYSKLGFAQVIQKPFSKGELIGILKLLGIETNSVPDTPAHKTAEDEKSEIYSLDTIYSFLGKNEDAIQEVLDTFLRDTHTNMRLLNETIDATDYKQINHVAHRMLPMFRQLRVRGAITPLEQLELAKSTTMDSESLNIALQKLISAVNDLVKALKERNTISPSYSD